MILCRMMHYLSETRRSIEYARLGYREIVFPNPGHLDLTLLMGLLKVVEQEKWSFQHWRGRFECSQC